MNFCPFANPINTILETCSELSHMSASRFPIFPPVATAHSVAKWLWCTGCTAWRGASAGVPLTDRSTAFMMSNLSVRRRGRGRERETGRGEVRSLRADEIKRDDLAIHASSDALSSCTVYVFWSNTDRQFSVFLQDILIKVHIAGSVIR